MHHLGVTKTKNKNFFNNYKVFPKHWSSLFLIFKKLIEKELWKSVTVFGKKIAYLFAYILQNNNDTKKIVGQCRTNVITA